MEFIWLGTIAVRPEMVTGVELRQTAGETPNRSILHFIGGGTLRVRMTPIDTLTAIGGTVKGEPPPGAGKLPPAGGDTAAGAGGDTAAGAGGDTAAGADGDTAAGAGGDTALPPAEKGSCERSPRTKLDKNDLIG